MDDHNEARPVYADFTGDTVAELVEFLSRYPGDMKARFLSEDVLVARVKGDTLFLQGDRFGLTGLNGDAGLAGM